MRDRPDWDKGCPTCKHGGYERILNPQEWFAVARWDCALDAKDKCQPPAGGPRANRPAGKLWEDCGYA